MKITEPGIYDIPMDLYHSDCCPGPSISSSGLRTIINQSPAEYWAFSYLNPGAYAKPDSPAFGFGRACHTLLLGDDDFHASYAVRPDEFRDWRKAEARRWKADREAEGKTVLVPDQMADIVAMSEVLGKHPLSKTLLEGEVEKSLIWQDHETGVWLKARPDVIPNFDRMVNDYKSTTSRIYPHQITADIFKYGYQMQMALVDDGLHALTDKRDLYYALTFQQTKAPYMVGVVEITPESIEIGRIQNRQAIRTFADCLDKGEWPAPIDGIMQVNPPEWLSKQVELTTAA